MLKMLAESRSLRRKLVRHPVDAGEAHCPVLVTRVSNGKARAPPIDRSLGCYDAPPSFKNDLDMLDRYQAFSGELLRIALLGLSGLGILIFKFFSANHDQNEHLFQPPFVVGCGIISAAVLFGIASAAALLHRYCSVDSMVCHLRVLRLESAVKKATTELERRKLMFKLSVYSIRVGAVSLAFGALAFVVAIVGVVFH
jgi:hypothetical protein